MFRYQHFTVKHSSGLKLLSLIHQFWIKGLYPQADFRGVGVRISTTNRPIITPSRPTVHIKHVCYSESTGASRQKSVDYWSWQLANWPSGYGPLRPVPTGPISRRPTPIISRLYCRVGRFYHRFCNSRPTGPIKHVQYFEPPGIGRRESADYCSWPAGNGPSGYGPLDIAESAGVCLVGMVLKGPCLLSRFPVSLFKRVQNIKHV